MYIIDEEKRIPIFKNDPIVVLILGFITCGLYLIYWNIKVAQVSNALRKTEVISTPVAVFAGCCYPVNAYFFYLVGRDVLPYVQRERGEPETDSTLLLLLLGIFIPMVAAMIVQGEINKLYR